MSNYFQQLYDIDVWQKTKEKNKLKYLPWSSAWAEMKERFPDATYRVDRDENNRFWFDDGRSGWVHIEVTVNGVTHEEYFPIMDHRNAAIAADKITATEANKAVKRGLTKCCADHGLGLYLYEGEELTTDGTRHTKEEKELAVARKKLMVFCKEHATDDKTRKVMYEIIAKNNGGNKNPNNVPTVELCEKIEKNLKEELEKVK